MARRARRRDDSLGGERVKSSAQGVLGVAADVAGVVAVVVERIGRSGCTRARPGRRVVPVPGCGRLGKRLAELEGTESPNTSTRAPSGGSWRAVRGSPPGTGCHRGGDGRRGGRRTPVAQPWAPRPSSGEAGVRRPPGRPPSSTGRPTARLPPRPRLLRRPPPPRGAERGVGRGSQRRATGRSGATFPQAASRIAVGHARAGRRHRHGTPNRRIGCSTQFVARRREERSRSPTPARSAGTASISDIAQGHRNRPVVQVHAVAPSTECLQRQRDEDAVYPASRVGSRAAPSTVNEPSTLTMSSTP